MANPSESWGRKVAGLKENFHGRRTAEGKIDGVLLSRCLCTPLFVAKILAGGQAGKRGSSGLTEVQKKQSYESFFTVTASDSHFKRYTRRSAAGCAGETFSARGGLFGGGSGLLVYHTPLRAFRPLPIAGSSCRARERKDPGVIRLTAATSRSVRNRQRFLSSSANRKPEFISPLGRRLT